MSRASHRESGFTLIEIIVVMVILAIFTAALLPYLSNTRVQQRNKAMQTVAQTVQSALVFYVRDYPRNGATAPDPLLTRGAGSPWKGNSDAPTAGMFSPTGDAYLKSWPTNPFGSGGVTVKRSASCPTTGTPGDVFVCRPAPAAGMGVNSFRIVAIGRNKSGAASVVHDHTTNAD